MATTPVNTDDRLPTTGPDDSVYDSHRFDTTVDDEALIYDDTTTDAWVQSTWAVSLEAWR